MDLCLLSHAAGFAQGIEAAAERIDREISNRQAQLSREGSALSDLKRPSVKYAIRRADLDARMSCRDAIRALAPQPEADPVREARTHIVALLDDLKCYNLTGSRAYADASRFLRALTGGQQ